MLPELGSFALILAFCFALMQALSLIGRSPALAYRVSAFAAWGQLGMLALAMLLLILCFFNNDMTVLYVRLHSHALLPLIYRLGAAWGGHEGSLLLWCLILAGWTSAFMLFSAAQLEISTSRKILAFLGIISSGFILFLYATSNPFWRDFANALANGDDLTPILQDPGLIFHPPILYLGYVGFAVAFAFALAALCEGKFSTAWVRACRVWVVLPWSFLSCGIVLGSSWAYRELGWGGWWFWDPVENASLLPWLSATALIHTLIVCEKRQVFQGWALLLAIVTFTLSLIGTFLVRSGVLVSVHAFANDPSRGLFLLVYLAIIIGGGFSFFAARIGRFYRAPHFATFSRETFLLLNSVILLAAVTTILIGTLYPIILDALDLEKISVGEPYFNLVFVPIMLPILLLMGFAPHVQWGQQALRPLLKKLRWPMIVSPVIGFAAPVALGFPFHGLCSVAVSLAIWITLATLQYAYTSKRHAAMVVAHLGIAVFVLGVALNKSYSEERQVKIHVGENVTIAGYVFTLTHVSKTEGENFHADTAIFAVQHPHTQAQVLSSELRVYTSHDQSLSKPGILTNPWRDLYVALGSELDDGAWSIRIYYKPFVRWIWAGGFMLLFGGLLSLLKRKARV